MLPAYLRLRPPVLNRLQYPQYLPLTKLRPLHHKSHLSRCYHHPETPFITGTILRDAYIGVVGIFFGHDTVGDYLPDKRSVARCHILDAHGWGGMDGRRRRCTGFVVGDALQTVERVGGAVDLVGEVCLYPSRIRPLSKIRATVINESIAPPRTIRAVTPRYSNVLFFSKSP